jgi:hypothetical protein
MASFPMKPIQRVSSTVMVFESERPGLREVFMARFKILPDFAITIFAMTGKLSRWIPVALLAICMPFQAALAVSTGQCIALKHHEAPAGQDGHDMHDHASHEGHDHGNAPGSPCGPCAACCASAAIAGTSGIALQLPRISAPVAAAPLQPTGVPPDKLDRPPLAL